MTNMLYKYKAQNDYLQHGILINIALIAADTL